MARLGTGPCGNLVAPNALAVSATIPKRIVTFLAAGMGARSPLTSVNYTAPFFGWIVQRLQRPDGNTLSVCRAYIE